MGRTAGVRCTVRILNSRIANTEAERARTNRKWQISVTRQNFERLRLHVKQLFKRATLAGVVLGLSACATTPVVRLKTVNVPTYIQTHIDAELLKACSYAEPDPACYRAGKREFCNGQLRDMRIGYRDALARCNADKAAIKTADGDKTSPAGNNLSPVGK